MTRRRRILAALFAVLAIVFAQITVAAHACDVVSPAKAAVVAPGHECCNEDIGDDGNSVPSGACVLHCHYGEASFDAGQPLAAIAETSGPALRVDSPDSLLVAAEAAGGVMVPSAAAPPASILFGVLRI